MAEEAQYELCHHEGSIDLAFDAGFQLWMLGHKVTQQVRPLPAPGGDGVWCLGYADSGEGYIDDGEVSRWVYEFLDQDVWLRNDGVTVIRGPTGEMTLERRMTTNLKCLATLALGPSRALVSFAFSIFFIRSGCRCWWSLLGIYRGLGLTGKHGNGARWAQAMWPSMDRVRILLGLHDIHLRRSATIGGETSDDDLDRVLLYPSVSTHMLIALCTRWSSLNRALGGLGTDREQQSVGNFLEELLHFLNGRSLNIVLRVSAGARWDPPLPVLGEACVSLDFVQGLVDISSLREQLRRMQLGGNRTAGEFLNAMVGFPDTCSLRDMLVYAATKKNMQVAWGASGGGRRSSSHRRRTAYWILFVWDSDKSSQPVIGCLSRADLSLTAVRPLHVCVCVCV